MRLKIYYENHLWVEEFNADESNDVVVSLNKFADLSHEEFISMYVGNKEQFKRKRPLNIKVLSEENLPDSVDWRTKGAVTPVKD
jgi:cathepsin L